MEEAYNILNAIARAEELRPQYAFVLAKLLPVRQPGIETITGDRYLRLYYDPEMLESWEKDTAAAMIILQLEHYYRNHPKRQGKRKQILWDYSALIAVTCNLIDEGLALPDNIVQPRHFKLMDGQPAEWYYNQLKSRCQKRADQLQRMAADALGTDPAVLGSASSAELKDWEKPEEEDSADGLLDYLNALQQEKEIRNQPSIPGHGSREDDITPNEEADSVINWRAKFSGLFGTAISTRPGYADYSYLVPDPDAALHPGIILPGMAEQIINVSMVIDSSASMHKNRLAVAVGETAAILRNQNASDGICLFTCDTVPHCARQIYHKNQITIVGGGGTDLGPGIRAASLRAPRPDVIVVITDGDTPWPKQGPLGIRVIVVLVGPTDNVPRWVWGKVKLPMD